MRKNDEIDMILEPVENLETFDAMPKYEREILIATTTEAYGETNIDGYGDYGAGYDNEQFIRNLIAMGWVFEGTPIKEDR